MSDTRFTLTVFSQATVAMPADRNAYHRSKPQPASPLERRTVCQRLFSALCLLLFAVMLSRTASAAGIDQLQIGYQGTGRLGAWLPVQVTASDLPPGESVQLHTTASDVRNNLCVETSVTGVADDDGSVTLNGYVRPGRLDNPIVVEVVPADTSDTRILCRHTVQCDEADNHHEADLPAIQQKLRLWRHDVRFLMTVGPVAGVEELLRNATLISEARPIVVGVETESLKGLPNDSLGYDSIDILLLTDRFQLNTEQLAALRQWVQNGGHLIVSSGGSVNELVAENLGEWLKRHFEMRPDSIEVLDLSAMQSLVPGSSRLETNRRSVRMAVVESKQPRVLAESLNGPLVSRASTGAGIITFVAVDLNQSPVSRWVSLPQLYGILMFDQTLTSSSKSGSRGSRISSTGVTDLATQLMATVDFQLGSGRWSTWGIMGLIFGYLLLIGPCDYVLVTIILKRPQLTWITFPVMVFAGCYFIYSMKAPDASPHKVAQVHIVDVDQDGDRHRILARSWTTLSTSTSQRSNVSAVPAIQHSEDTESDTRSWLSWAGRPEDVYGGLYRTGGVSLGRQQYQHNQSSEETQSTLRELPLLADGSVELFSQWSQTSSTPLIESRLNVSGFGLLEGDFSHHLPGNIEDWILAYGNRVYRPAARDQQAANLAPGRAISPRGDGVITSDLQSFLNGTRIVVGKESDSSVKRIATQTITPYSIGSRDPRDVAIMITFYEAAGGASYVGLQQNSLSRMELSDTIRLNHAVLIGTMKTPATALAIDDQALTPEYSVTIVRLLLPVDRRPAGPSSQMDMELLK